MLWEAKLMLGMRTFLFAGLVGAAAFANAALFPLHRNVAFSIGACLGAIAFLAWARPARLQGAGLLGAAALWVGLMLNAGIVQLVWR